jgi:hypothetical protein
VYLFIYRALVLDQALAFLLLVLIMLIGSQVDVLLLDGEQTEDFGFII